MTRRPTDALKRFLANERGSFTTEAVIILPILIWAYVAMFVFWDAYKTQNVNLKATYTIADMISREVDPITQCYIDGARSIYAFLNMGDANQQVRVSVVTQRIDGDGNEFLDLSWSQHTEGVGPYTDIGEVEDIVPMMAVGDQVIIVNTFTDWTPVFNVGLPAMTLSETVVTSPRFVPQVIYNSTCA